MELQFNKTVYGCLHRVVREVQNQEQTQELRLPDGMPDIGRVLGAWGQILMRGKEWRSGSMGVSGGIMVWVLYASEEDGAPMCVDTWIPFQMKWDLPDTQRDGTIRASFLLRGVDARSVSARKLMLRTGVSALGEAFVPGTVELFTPGELPQDVQVLRRTYPMRMPRETGEKSFLVDEELSLPPACPKLKKLIRYSLQPEMIDQKVMAGKAVFRGAAIVHILYQAEDDGLYSWDFEVPFSQYSELERDYDQEADISTSPAVTSLELEAGEEGKLRLKAGLTGQYVVYDRAMIELVEDAYSPNRAVTPQTQTFEVPMVLDERREMIHAEHTVEMEGMRAADVAFYPDQAYCVRDLDGVSADLSGVFQVLCYDAEGALQGAAPRWNGTWSLPADQDSRVELTAWPSGTPQASVGAGGVELRGDVMLEAMTTGQQGLEMVTALELGEMTEPDPGRPSLILRAMGADSLWELAKSSGSTVEAIRKANGLQDDPDPGRLLLIPVS